MNSRRLVVLRADPAAAVDPVPAAQETLVDRTVRKPTVPPAADLEAPGVLVVLVARVADVLPVDLAGLAAALVP